MRRIVGVGVAAIALFAVAAPLARGPEIVPSIGLTRAAESEGTKSNVGVALRSGLVSPVLQTEIGVGYRREEYAGGGLEATMVPVTVSLLARPLPTIHGDAGVGWYHTKYEYTDPLLADETVQKFGVHMGGGIQIPVAPGAALDLTGRYVFLKSQESKLVPQEFNPDFWTLSLGLALKL